MVPSPEDRQHSQGSCAAQKPSAASRRYFVRNKSMLTGLMRENILKTTGNGKERNKMKNEN